MRPAGSRLFTTDGAGSFPRSASGRELPTRARVTLSNFLFSGDFDQDGDVDGHDFLVWQRNPAVGKAALWKAQYGSNLLVPTVAAVPEPAATGWLLPLVRPRANGRGLRSFASGSAAPPGSR